MEIKVISKDLTEYKCDAVIVNLFEGVKTPGGSTGAADKALGGLISSLIKEGEITGKLGETRIIHAQGKISAERILVAGLGKQEDFNYDKIRQVSASSAKALRNVGAKKIATIVHGAGIGGMDPKISAQALAEGAILGLYRFRKYLSEKPEEKDIEEITILEKDEKKVPEINEGVKQGTILANATNDTRDLVNEPANNLTPTKLAEIAKKIAKDFNLEYHDLNKDKMWELGMGALLSVAQGSDEPPQLVVLRYSGAESEEKAVGLIGKGITFDSGGISLKPSQGMGEMKTDMAGAAVVLSAIKAIAQLKPKINVCAVIPCLENMPSGKASRPGDVVKAMNGKTIEIITTDAEGRMILADAICYAKKLGLSPIIDIATLTGAVSIALGKSITAILGNDKKLVSDIIKAGEDTGEKFWELPLFEEYKELLKSDIADLKNTGNGTAGVITGALFIGSFAEKTPWVHLDIGGTARKESESPYITKGATGATTRSLVDLILTMAQK